MNSKSAFPQNYLEKVYEKVNLEEGETVIEQILLEVYFHAGVSTKELARKSLLPVPLVAAIKNEFMKAGILVQDRGVRLTEAGSDYIEKSLGFQGINRDFYTQLFSDSKTGLEQEIGRLRQYFNARPQVDVTIDQSKATPATSLNRAVLCLRNHALIGKKILCVGDDDLVSVSLGFLLKKLYANIQDCRTQIQVVDIDGRFLEFIGEIARAEELPVVTHSIDLRQPLPSKLQQQFDCYFTDPPYTIPGLNLFLSRGISALKPKVGLPVFLSFAHKSPDFTLQIHQELQRMGLATTQVIPRFNEYEGAEIIGNTGQMIILRTTRQTRPVIGEAFNEAIYTGELKKTLRIYQCKECGNLIKVGFGEEFTTIETVKEKGCPVCESSVFDRVERTIIS